MPYTHRHSKRLVTCGLLVHSEGTVTLPGTSITVRFAFLDPAIEIGGFCRACPEQSPKVDPSIWGVTLVAGRYSSGWALL